MSAHIAQCSTTNAVPSPEELVCREEKLKALLSGLNIVLEERMKIKNRVEQLEANIEAVSNSPETTNAARPQHLEESNATAAPVYHARDELEIITEQAWALREVFDEAVADHSNGAASCRPLCETMQRLLPRELRDMIYGALLDTKPWLSDHCFKGNPNNHYDEVHACECFMKGARHEWENKFFDIRCRALMPRHLQSSEALGQETFRELVEEWYQTAKTRIVEPNAIATFLQHDVFNLGITAASHSRKVHLSIETHGYGGRFSYNAYSDEWSTIANSWKDNMEDLRLLTNSAKISVTLFMSVKGIRYYPTLMRSRLSTLQLILFALAKLPNAGDRITISTYTDLRELLGVFVVKDAFPLPEEELPLQNATERVQVFLQKTE